MSAESEYCLHDQAIEQRHVVASQAFARDHTIAEFPANTISSLKASKLQTQFEAWWLCFHGNSI
jgi:hypothetical protein